jgi:hypothetical protein
VVPSRYPVEFTVAGLLSALQSRSRTVSTTSPEELVAD